MSIQTLVEAVSGIEPVKSVVERVAHDEDARITLHTAAGSSSAFVVADVARSKHTSGLVVCLLPEESDASYLKSDLTVLLEAANAGGGRVLQIPASGLRPYDRQQSAAYAHVQERMDAILAVEDGFQGVVIVSAESLYERIPPPSVMEKKAPVVRVGQEVRPEDLVEQLIEIGFSVEEYVGEPGEMAFRGGIVDLYPFAGDYPIRLEFFGDEIESIREFDPNSQRSVSTVKSARLVPDPGELPDDVEFGTLFEFLSGGEPIFVFEPERLFAELDRLLADAVTAHEELSDGQTADGREAPSPETRFTDSEIVRAQLSGRPVVFVRGGDGEEVRLGALPPPPFNKSVALLRDRIASNTADGTTTMILCDGRGQLGRLEELLGEKKTSFDYTLVLSTLHQGFELPAADLAVYTDHEIFGRYHRPTSGKRRKSSQRMSVAQLSSLKPGDFVVHVDHGIGRFGGLQKKTVRGQEQEVVKLLYEKDDILFVNINSLHRLDKFSAREGHAPRLTRLGSGQWERAKSKAKKRVKDIARGLIKLYAERKAADGFTFSADTVWQRELEASFQYEDTPDQFQASEDVKEDMQQQVPMDRLVCGDVGFGKTEVAVRAAFKAVQDGKQVAVLVPTTILAVQHHKTFSDRLGPFAVKVEALSRFQTSKEQKDIVSRLKEGKVDIVIGTQRLVSKDVQFEDLGLLIIDEEQRFGVAVKEKIRTLRSAVDTLTLTATPIPRTLQFSLMGARDLSIINTPPPNRQPIVTEIHSWDTRLVRDAILYEVNRGGQVFFVHNRVKSIDDMAAKLGSLVEGVRFGVAHGQMKARNLESVMVDFLERRFDVLVCTNIVESGLDVTNANTMIIDRAETFGLSDLHQLRGRVGRSDKRAFCYMFVPSIHTLTREARHRLRAIEEFSDLGSGFNIAMRDLDIRGAGNLLGAEQSGFIDEIGFETYHRILDEAVSELRNEEFAELFGDREQPIPTSDSTVELETDALIPASYVSSANLRLDLYRRLAEAGSETGVHEILEEMDDRFGPAPPEVGHLAAAANIRITAESLRLPRIEFKRNRLFLTIPPKSDEIFYERVFESLLESLSNLENRFVIKELRSKTKLIVQDVPDLEGAVSIMRKLTPAR